MTMRANILARLQVRTLWPSVAIVLSAAGGAAEIAIVISDVRAAPLVIVHTGVTPVPIPGLAAGSQTVATCANVPARLQVRTPWGIPVSVVVIIVIVTPVPVIVSIRTAEIAIIISDVRGASPVIVHTGVAPVSILGLAAG